jgi:hypothetical protein
MAKLQDQAQPDEDPRVKVVVHEGREAIGAFLSTRLPPA